MQGSSASELAANWRGECSEREQRENKKQKTKDGEQEWERDGTQQNSGEQ